MGLIERVPSNQVAHEVAVDLVLALDGGNDEGLDCELIDASRTALPRFEQTFHGGFDQKVGVDFGALQVESDVVKSGLEAEGTQRSAVRNREQSASQGGVT